MCRMILAHGEFDVLDILRAAVQMSHGETARHNCPIKVHPNGWGGIWCNEHEPDGFSTYRSTKHLTIEEGVEALSGVQSNFVALHARHATVPKNQGVSYSHPLAHDTADTRWHLMHNGYLPTVYQKLSLEESSFDSAEYIAYVAPSTGNDLRPKILNAKLESLSPGGNSGNAFFINRRRAYAYQWYPEDSLLESYFTLFRLEVGNATIVSSERIPGLAQAHRWDALQRGDLIEFDMT